MTHAEFEYELVEALNMLLEDERASVEMEVALASGATEYAERQALGVMGVEDIHFCEQLRLEMEREGLPVTPQINGVVFQVIGAERYDDRLRAFAHHQRVVAERARELQESNLDGVLRDALEGIAETHDRHAQWTEQRASEFAATRTLEFGSPNRSASADESPDDTSDNTPDETPEDADPMSAAQVAQEDAAPATEPEPPMDREAPAEEVSAQEVVIAPEESPTIVEEPVATPKPKTRATRTTARATTAAKTTKAATKATKATRAKAPATRRTRQVPADGAQTEA